MSENPTISTTPTAAGPLFPLGQVVITPGICDSGLDAAQLAELLRRHVVGDWEMDAEDIAANQDAIQHGARVFGGFQPRPDLRIWIITEAGRASTCVLLPSEY